MDTKNNRKRAVLNMQSFLSEDRYSKEYNWLIMSKSPYLQQHKKNPVNWLEWSPEAFEKAKREDKPIFLSIGYSTCHWCHVMERESFEDSEVAALLNKYFVSVKVDREERPDVDSVYMNVCQMLTGQGGWPLNVFLTFEQKPFYAGTYFPRESMYGRPGMLEILPQLHEQYENQHERISEIAENITEGLNEYASNKGRQEIDENVIHQAYEQISEQFDEEFGGFGGEPKFPMPHQLMFLLSYYAWTGNEQALLMVDRTLHSIADGGIYDHIGGGFARYSTDRIWLVPHFEKMLTDNALLLYVISDLYLIKKEKRWEDLVKETFAFLKREMSSPDGAFYSAIDADSEGVEGKYYVWDRDVVAHILGREKARIFCKLFDISEGGNFEGKSIPNLIQNKMETFAKLEGISQDELNQMIEDSKVKLLAARERRTYPRMDDKILTSWNALMIAALAKAGSAFDEVKYISAAEKALDFIEQNLWSKESLFARYREEEVRLHSYLDDYAYLLWAYIELFESTQEIKYLTKAEEISAVMTDRFWDKEHGGYYFTSNKGEALIIREKQLFDQAQPSGNSVAAFQLWRLAKITGKEELQERADGLLTAFGKKISQYPSGPIYMLQAVMAKYAGGEEIFVSGNDEIQRKSYRKKYNSEFMPFNILVEIQRKEQGLYKEWEGKYIEDQPFALFKCKNYSCTSPNFSLKDALEKCK